jgi:dTDP-4-amino-4,6-dideoxygalactose transaminase
MYINPCQTHPHSERMPRFGARVAPANPCRDGILADRVQQLEAECKTLRAQVHALTSELQRERETVTELSAGVHSQLNTTLLSKYEKLLSANAESTRMYTDTMQHAQDTISQQKMLIEQLNKKAENQSNAIFSLALTLSERKERNEALEKELREMSKTTEQYISDFGEMSNNADRYKSIIRQIQERLECPITKNIFTDPLVSVKGQTFENSAISKWLDEQHTCPMTRMSMNKLQLFPNWVVKDICDLVRNV